MVRTDLRPAMRSDWLAGQIADRAGVRPLGGWELDTNQQSNKPGILWFGWVWSQAAA
jgi:hypothetical protein